MAGSNPSSSNKDISIRVQIFAPGPIANRNGDSLKAYRLRLKDDSSFIDLASIALARYAKDDPEKGKDARIAHILDEKDCAVDFDDAIDIIQPGEILKLVLATPQDILPSNAPADKTAISTTAFSSASQTPAVGSTHTQRRSSISSSDLKHCPPPQPANRASPQTKPTPSQPVQRLAIKSTLIPLSYNKFRRTGGKLDPYELSSNNEVITTRSNARQELLSAAPTAANNGAQVAASQPKLFPNSIKTTPLTTQRSAAPRSNNTIPSDAKVISIRDSPSSSSDEEGELSLRRQLSGTSNISLRRGTPAVKQVIVKKGAASSASSTKSSSSHQSSRSIGSLTLTPSRVADAARRYKAKLEREAADREAARKLAAQEKIEQDNAQKEARLKARRNLPSAAIAHVKKLTRSNVGHGGKEEKLPIPRSFFVEPQYSDEDLGDIIHGTQSHRAERGIPDGRRAPPNTIASKPSVSASQTKRPATGFRPITRSWSHREPNLLERPALKFGGGYSQRVRDAFSDSEDSVIATPKDIELTHHKQSLEGKPEVDDNEAFLQWANTYKTNYIPHMNYCSVADGPFKGLIQGGSQSGTYLPGYKTPTCEKIAEMAKTALPIFNPDTSDFSESECATSDEAEGDDYSEKLPEPAKLLSLKLQNPETTPSSGFESASALAMRQWSQEAPPSNQELGLLMTSSPARPSRSTDVSVQTPTVRRSTRLSIMQEATENCDTIRRKSDSFEKMVHQKSPVVRETPRRSNRLCHDTDLDVTPNFERALSQVETPSTRSRSHNEPSSINLDPSNEQPCEATARRFVVKIPEMPAGQQAEYDKIPDLVEENLSDAPLRSFKDLNNNNNNNQDDDNGESQDSGVAAIEDILDVSPAWLTTITTIDTPSARASSRAPYALRDRTRSSSIKKEAVTPKKRKVDETKDQDPTYYPSGINSDSRSSASTERPSPRKIHKTHSNATPRRLQQQHLKSTGPNYHDDAIAFPSNNAIASTPNKSQHDTVNTRPTIISSTPIPAPTTSDLLQKTKHIHPGKGPVGTLGSVDTAKPLSQTQARHQGEYAGGKSYPDAAALAPVLRKHTASKDAVSKDDQDSKKRKKSSKSKKNKKNKRKLLRQGVQSTSTAPMTAVTRPSIVQMSPDAMKDFKHRVKEVMSTGYGDDPTFPPLVIKKEIPEELVPSRLNSSQNASPGNNKRKVSRSHALRSARRKLPSPPATSRPSSAGSKL